MSRHNGQNDRARGRLLEAWEPPEGAGDPVGVIASTFTFDAGFFEEELLGRYLVMESSVDDGRCYLVEREKRLGEVSVTVLVDRRHVSRSTTLAWDLLPVPPPPGGCQHAKVTILAWEKLIRLIVGSANLTEPAYRRNLETYAVLDFAPESPLPASLLEAFLGFLRRMIERASDPDEVAGGADGKQPRIRATEFLNTISRLADNYELPNSWPRGEVAVSPVLLEPDRGPGVLDALDELWGAHPRPSTAFVLSPFWSCPRDAEREPLLEDLVPRLSRRGELDLHLFAPAREDTVADRWLVELPDALKRTAARFPMLRLRVHPIRMRLDGESRPLHAKAIWWGSESDRELLLVGSSNATPAGLGLGGHARNLEANVCFLNRRDRVASRWFAACFPACDAVDCDLLRFEGTPLKPDEEGGIPPVPAFFRWAVLDRSGGAFELRIGLGGEGEPPSWAIATEDKVSLLDSKEYGAQGRPPVWTARLPADPATTPPPTLIVIRWRQDVEEFVGGLPVNALNAESRSRPDLWRDIDLDTLLDLLASSGPIHRQLARILRRHDAANGRPSATELDPHRRVDTSDFLMQRIRRISRALEGLKEKLSAPVQSENSLDWRFKGPQSPAFLAKKLIETVEDPDEKRFLLAEIILIVGSAARGVTSTTMPLEMVRRRYEAAVIELVKMSPEGDGGGSPVGRYFHEASEKALEKARR